ncbi:MAG: hypothetical protein Q7J10_03010 [Methanosarcinaceae archaeon]|nr:hypothetical protein [Methanosarcinaceae archaeon]
MSEEVNKIVKRFKDLGVDVDPSEVSTKLEQLVTEYHVPQKEAVFTVSKMLAKDHGIELKAQATTDVNVKEVLEMPSGQWVSVPVKVSRLFENTHASVKQTGVVGDETGTVSFIIGSRANVPTLEEGKCYFFENVVTGIFNERPQLSVNKASKITPLDTDMEIHDYTTIIEGAIVDIQNGSGLIKRCPQCKRMLSKGACNQHGRVDGVYDLRIKAVLDDGKVTNTLLLNREITEQLTGISLDDAIVLAADALDAGVISDRIKQMIIGRYYKVEVSPIGRFQNVCSIESVTGTAVNPAHA